MNVYLLKEELLVVSDTSSTWPSSFSSTFIIGYCEDSMHQLIITCLVSTATWESNFSPIYFFRLDEVSRFSNR